MGTFLAKLLLLLIRFYQYGISPMLPARCRFYPTCSNYGLEAIRLHGAFRGGWLTVRRVCRCHPWGDSGIDFVPLPLYRYHYFFVGKQVSDGDTGGTVLSRNFI